MCRLRGAHRAWWRIVLLWSALAGVGLGSDVLELDSSALRWERLVFAARDEVQVEVNLAEVPQDVARRTLVTDLARRRLEERDAEALLLTAKLTDEDSDRRYLGETWFLARDGTALQRRRDKIADKGNRKIFRFFEDGVVRTRIDPDGRREARLPVDQWSRVRMHLFAYGPSRDGCAAVLDPAAVLYALSARALPRGGGTLTLCVFNKKTLYRVTLRAEADEPVRVDFAEWSQEGREQVSRDVTARRVVLRARADPAASQEPDPFEFFELRGDVIILLDPVSLTPLRISGEISGVDVDLDLRAVERPD